MKITHTRLRSLIKEELQKVSLNLLNESLTSNPVVKDIQAKLSSSNDILKTLSDAINAYPLIAFMDNATWNTMTGRAGFSIDSDQGGVAENLVRDLAANGVPIPKDKFVAYKGSLPNVATADRSQSVGSDDPLQSVSFALEMDWSDGALKRAQKLDNDQTYLAPTEIGNSQFSVVQSDIHSKIVDAVLAAAGQRNINDVSRESVAKNIYVSLNAASLKTAHDGLDRENIQRVWVIVGTN